MQDELSQAIERIKALEQENAKLSAQAKTAQGKLTIRVSPKGRR